MNVILIGFKACGKSTIGVALAHRLNMAFVDTDQLLEHMHAAMTNEVLSFRQIYQRYGKAYFGELEQQVIEQLAQLDEYVIASGGQTFINHAMPAELRACSTIVYLDVAPEILIERIKADGKPASFEGDLETSFWNTYQQRHPLYQQIADRRVDASHRSVADAVDAVVAALEH